MKKLRLAGHAFGLLMLTLLVTFSCQKEKDLDQAIPEGQQRIRIRLSDNAINFDAVNVDIQAVEVLVAPDSCSSGNNGNNCLVWTSLTIRPGVYNLLDLSNGVDTLLANGFTAAGEIKKIRLTLGTANSVVIDSVSYPLTLYNNNNQITISVKGEDIDEITPGDLQLWLDFDAGRSIVRLSNNRFVLKPYLRLWLPAQTASIKGEVIPERARAVVSAIANGDTLVAIPDRHDGDFKIRGLKGISAIVFINATANGYQDTTITGVPLERGKTTDIGTIRLRN